MILTRPPREKVLWTTICVITANSAVEPLFNFSAVKPLFFFLKLKLKFWPGKFQTRGGARSGSLDG